MDELTVGELARRSGVTVRTLHHYDRTGLLVPTRRSASGYRLYGEPEVARLQQILSLRQLGFSLDEVHACLEDPAFTPLRVVELHRERLRERIEAQQRLLARLEALADHLRAARGPAVEEFLRTMEMMAMLEKYYTTEQLQALEARRREVGDDRIREVEAEWPRLIAEVRSEMEKGTDPGDPRVQALARRYRALIDEFTGGDPGIERSLRSMYQQERTVAGMDTTEMRAMGEYLSRAGA